MAGRFVKGQSGNPGGRPKSDVKLRDLARTRTAQCFKMLDAIAFGHGGRKDSDRIAAIAIILDRGWGKAVQPVDGDGDGGPVKLEVAWLPGSSGGS